MISEKEALDAAIATLQGRVRDRDAEIERLQVGLRHAEIGLQQVICPSDPETHACDIRECELALDSVRKALGGAEQKATP